MEACTFPVLLCLPSNDLVMIYMIPFPPSQFKWPLAIPEWLAGSLSLLFHFGEDKISLSPPMSSLAHSRSSRAARWACSKGCLGHISNGDISQFGARLGKKLLHFCVYPFLPERGPEWIWGWFCSISELYEGPSDGYGWHLLGFGQELGQFQIWTQFPWGLLGHHPDPKEYMSFMST